MDRGPWRGRWLAVLTACLVAAFAATATVLSVSMAATGTSAATKGAQKVKPKSGSLTKAEVIALIKQYSKSGSKGATGPAGKDGPKGATGLAGAAGAKGENGAKGETGVKGENGTDGENGFNGAVSGYSVSQPPTGPGEGVAFAQASSTSPVTVLSKSLPPGDYVASAKVQVSLAATGKGGEGDVECGLLDTPTSGSPVEDAAGFFSATNAPLFAIAEGAATTLPLEVAINAGSASTLTIDCWVDLSSGGETALKEPGIFIAEASKAHIQAVQTSTIS